MSTFIDRLADLRFNPALMQDMVYDELEKALDGEYDVPDPSSPFAFALETAVMTSAMPIIEFENILRRLYPSLAQNEEELYLHMADQDYLGRFSTPARTTFEIYISKQEILSQAIPVPGVGFKKLVIPRLTSFTVGGTTFTMQYPIEIRIMSHGGLQIVYNTDDISPIQTLTTNLVDWRIATLNREELVILSIPVSQIAVQTQIEVVNTSNAFNVSYEFSDRFYYARVYMDDGNGWEEIHTTHTEEVYNPREVTAVLTVLNQSLNIKIPLIYFTQGQISGEVRVDIYTTKGRIELDFGAFSAEEFNYDLNAIDDDSTYVSPLNNFSRFAVLNANRISGGSNALSFNELRSRVIQNSLGQNNIPITHAQLGNEVENYGYRLVTNIDNITNRQFLASRLFPSPETDGTEGSVGCTLGSIQNTLEEFIQQGYVHDNNERLTLRPERLYVYENGQIRPLTEVEIATIENTSKEMIATTINNGRYLYSPLHYVLDTQNQRFDVRPYYLDDPQILSKRFVTENDTAGIQVGIDTYDIERIENGYRITVKLTSGDLFKSYTDSDVYVQIGYKPKNETNYASVNGVLVGMEDDERIYQFDIETNFDIDDDNRLYTTNLSLFDLPQTNFACALEDEFEITFIVAGTSVTSYVPGLLDSIVQRHLLPNEFTAISRESLRVRLGVQLSNLWRRHRSVIGEYAYQRYTEDVPATYSERVYEKEVDGNIKIEDDGAGGITYTILHEAGDPVLDEQDNPIMAHLAGDAILDGDGNPLLVGPRKIRRELTLVLFDATYYFADTNESSDYRILIPSTLVSWVEDDIGNIQNKLLEQSELFLYPTNTFGDAEVIVKESMKANVSLEQSLAVNYYMTINAYEDVELRDALSETTSTLISEALKKSTVAISDIISLLRENAGEDVLSIEVTGLGGDQNYSTISMIDDATRLSLGKRLTVLSTQELDVEDDIDINFLLHNSER